MNLRILSEADCRSLIDMPAAIDIQAEAFTLLATGQSVQGLRGMATSETPPGVAIFNPSFLRGGGGYGIKVVSDFYDNEAQHLPRMSALVALFDGRTGLPTSVMEGGFLTDLRTGAGTGLAARHLARKDSRTLALIGAGRVARNQLEGLAASFDLRTVLIATRSEARGRAFIDRMRSRIGAELRLVDSPEVAIRDADIVVAATTSRTPVVAGAWLAPGTFVASTGAYDPAAREVDSEVVRRAAVRVIDSRADCLERAGDFQFPIREGVVTRESIAEISEILSGARPGRRNSTEITHFKSSGVPIQDLVTAQHIERRAVELGIGTMLDIGGDGDAD